MGWKGDGVVAGDKDLGSDLNWLPVHYHDKGAALFGGRTGVCLRGESGRTEKNTLASNA